MSIQRYDILHPKMRDKGRFVLYADHIADKQSALDAQQAAHAAEVERLTGERDALSQKLKMTEEELDEVQGKLDDSEDFSSASLAIILRHVGEPELEDGDFVSITDLEQAVMRHNKASDAAVRERDAACEALRKIVAAGEKEVFDQITMSTVVVDGDVSTAVDIARAALAEMEQKS